LCWAISREDAVLATLEALTGPQAVDLLLSDMAPNLSGMNAIDQPRALLAGEGPCDGVAFKQ
jgi:23S rRNA (uridine2552-2'-O)-methyltransferase